jgi:tryptophanyl-tRNA synthetase
MTSRPVMLSGIKPTNRLTLGNYLGAIKNWVQLQNQYHCYFMAVDLHSITVRQTPEELRENTLLALATYLACGIHPDHATIFIQSQVHEHSQLAWILNCNSYMGELNRMTQFKDKSAKAGSNIPAGLFSYPTLMAADILLYDADLVPVGADQKQHIELTRDLAIRMNGIYGEDTFIVPEPFIAKVGARIMDLQEPQSKMGKSDSSESGAIFLSDTAKIIEKKFKRAVTDSGTEITYESEKAGVKNLLDIQSAITGRPTPELVASYQGKMYGHLKLDTAAIVADELTPIQDKISRYLGDRGELMQILKIGRDRAAEQAEKTIKRIHQRIGFVIS